jgi:hypothetical protein
VSVEVVEPQGHVLRTGSVIFTAAESRRNQIKSPQDSEFRIVRVLGH